MPGSRIGQALLVILAIIIIFSLVASAIQFPF
jgi:hypothetical protein